MSDENDDKKPADPEKTPANPEKTPAEPSKSDDSKKKLEELQLANAELAKKISAMEAEKQDKEEAEKKAAEERLKSENDFEALYKNEKKKREEAETQSSEYRKEVENGIKTQALTKELAKAGLKPDYQNRVSQLADLNNIKIDPNTNQVYGQDAEVEKIKTNFADLFTHGKQPPEPTKSKEAGGSPPKTGTLTIAEWQNLSATERLRREKDIDWNKTD